MMTFEPMSLRQSSFVNTTFILIAKQEQLNHTHVYAPANGIDTSKSGTPVLSQQNDTIVTKIV